MKLLSLLAAMLFLAGSCVGPAGLDYGEEKQFEVMQSDLGGYRLAPGDGIEVVFAYHPTRNIQLTVRPDGRISMPFAEEVQAAGRTVEELDHDLSEMVSKHLKDAELSVVVRSYARQRVYVGGEVRNPREFDLTPGMTLSQAVVGCGWFTHSAADNSVVLIRQAGPGLRKAMKFDFSEDALIQHDIVLEPFDIVYVPRSSIARVGVWVDEHINKILPRGVNISFLAFRGRQEVF